jgi:hypothetical protein
MIEKFIRHQTLAGRAIGCLLAAMVVNVFVGTAPAQSAGWFYAWADGRCWMTMSDATQRAGLPAPDPRIWRSATRERCRNVGIPVGSSTPSLAAKILVPNNDRFPLGGGGRGQSNSQGNSFPGKTR